MSFNDATCACEQNGTSPYGPVQDAERLARVIISPLHIEEKTGRPKPSAFQSEDLMHRGLSLLRLAYLDESELARQGSKLCKDFIGRSVHGYMVGSAGAVRDLRDSADRKAFCVVDDDIEDQQMHATLMRSADQDKVDIKELRARLMKIFDPLFVSAAEAI